MLLVKDNDNNIIKDAIFSIIVKDNIICNNLTFTTTEIIDLLKIYNKDVYIYIYPTEKIKKYLFVSLIIILYDTDPYADEFQIENINIELELFFRSIVSEYLAIELCKKNGEIIKFFNNSLKSNKNVAIACINENLSTNYHGIYWIEDNLKNNKEFMLTALKISPRYIFYCSLNLLKDNDILEIGKKLSDDINFYIYNEEIDIILNDKKHNLKNNKNFMLFAVKINGKNISKASLQLQEDLDIIKTSNDNYRNK